MLNTDTNTTDQIEEGLKFRFNIHHNNDSDCSSYCRSDVLENISEAIKLVESRTLTIEYIIGETHEKF